jgi:hypothetical protein
MNIFQGMSALMCLLTIAKEFGEHHFHELSGKTDIPSLGMIFCWYCCCCCCSNIGYYIFCCFGNALQPKNLVEIEKHKGSLFVIVVFVVAVVVAAVVVIVVGAVINCLSLCSHWDEKDKKILFWSVDS